MKRKINACLQLAVALFIIQASSCNSQECRFCNSNQQGAVYQNIRCETDTSVMYNLYVPEGTNDTKLPVLILLDPHGKTANAVKKYVELAEKYHVILAGFDASANDVPFAVSWKKFKPWISELFIKAPVDSTRIFIAGFSGGARVASLIEDRLPELNATALCGAGPADLQMWTTHSKPVMLFAGTGDFNYLEISGIHDNPDINRPRSLSIFPGGHEWPPADAMEDFFVLIHRISKKNPAVDEQYFISRSRKFLASGRPDIALYSASSAIYALGEENCRLLKKFKDSLANNISPQFISEMNSCKTVELSLQKSIGNLFQNADTIRYFALIDSIDNQIRCDSLSLKSDVMRRAKAYCGIAAYSFSNQAKKMKVPFFFNILRMYEYTEPDNSDMLILFSAYYAEKKECMKARIYLNNAKRQGFNDMKKLHGMKEFDNCDDILN